MSKRFFCCDTAPPRFFFRILSCVCVFVLILFRCVYKIYCPMFFFFICRSLFLKYVFFVLLPCFSPSLALVFHYFFFVSSFFFSLLSGADRRSRSAEEGQGEPGEAGKSAPETGTARAAGTTASRANPRATSERVNLRPPPPLPPPPPSLKCNSRTINR